MQGFRARLDYTLKHNAIINKIFRFSASTLIKLIGLFIPMDEKAILFSGHSRKYNDSPCAIYEYMISCPKYAEYKFFWALEENDDTIIPGQCIIVKPDSIKYFVTALKCKYWITCVNIERSLRFKRKKTIYLNTWHGIPIKTVGNDAAGRRDYDFSHIDYFCISGDYEIDLYKRAFNVGEEQLLKTGMPRNDYLYRAAEHNIIELKAKMNLPLDKKIILYAPTWRDSKDGGKSYEIMPPIDLRIWEERLGAEYILLLRTHPYTNKLLGVEFNEFVRDFTDYPSINELMIVSDVLVSDYSATIFDFSILQRPIICFAYDLDEYANERGLEMDIRTEMPGGVISTEEEVINSILAKDKNELIDEVVAFNKRYIKYGGYATKTSVEVLFGEK